MIEAVGDERKLDRTTFEFLVMGVFGCTYESILDQSYDNSSAAIEICARRAYRDLNRTLRFKRNEGESDSEFTNRKDSFRNGMCKILARGIEEMIQCRSITEFDRMHFRICADDPTMLDVVSLAGWSNRCSDILKPIGSDGRRFYSGHAQKWLNMTLKYLRMLDLKVHKNDLLRCESWLHIPIDNVVLKAFWESGAVLLPLKDGRWAVGSGMFCVDKLKAWSRWSCKDYYCVVCQYRKSDFIGDLTPIAWEESAWLGIRG